jgi:hypothetical protein
MTHNLLGKAALFTGTVALAAIITTGPAMSQPAPQPGQDGAGVGISNQSARVRDDLSDIAANRAALPAPAPKEPTPGTNGDLTVLGGGAAGLLVAAAAGVTVARRHKGTAPRIA